VLRFDFDQAAGDDHAIFLFHHDRASGLDFQARAVPGAGRHQRKGDDENYQLFHICSSTR
jgi:hypothetical protein